MWSCQRNKYMKRKCKRGVLKKTKRAEFFLTSEKIMNPIFEERW